MTTKTTMIRMMWSERKRTERTFLANLEASKRTAKRKKTRNKSLDRASSASRSEDEDSSAYRIYYIHDCSLLPNRTISLDVIRRAFAVAPRQVITTIFEARLG
ncbi:hypothetical protein P5V15_010541 [Pogonomyrmex californicus]